MATAQHDECSIQGILIFLHSNPLSSCDRFLLNDSTTFFADLSLTLEAAVSLALRPPTNEFTHGPSLCDATTRVERCISVEDFTGCAQTVSVYVVRDWFQERRCLGWIAEYS